MTATVREAAVSRPDTKAPFFDGGDGRYEPRPHARSPWSENLVHGRLVSGLMAREVEREHLADGFHPARMTTDLFRPIPMGPIDITTYVRRAGRRVRIVEVQASVDGMPVASASVQALLAGAESTPVAWSPVEYRAPAPESVSPPVRQAPRHFGEVRRLEPSEDGRKFSWFRETCRLLEGIGDTPFEIAAMAADWVSPFTNMGAKSLNFINADVTLYLSRLPIGEWIGFENLDHAVDNGVAVSVCALHDEQGRIGTAASAALPY
ncbi:thioesterase family protein [Rhodococcus sp. BP-252]|uniref:acyl-CoA thioesterase domain-containing protein n=1 Tax=unclassified Rhodococcus (in: high G+C Gram-positive bacteria) TaxID=192944 RepID=UPI0014311CFF|nr:MULTISPECIES: acyl-CoA thioesterase domain-containing protein [unclassified Rhodococcus (in: high G+C Gram-positive bacteria)]MBY6410842.1 thioesterase family protein [Rhodococcus sp. BP-320]MBY6415333.1 thioesterase family protein [Rhodococcus sp. BP-321]MBY6419948.1 thioesterase family protein [Rhodococcus sp. BP-324]MBY6425398.1 thioesterase family protein [Rhodococcus sp. BP-323]MBY6430539.1 thioesterase family protein [Rhodococcus sp. BP-322]